MILRVVMASHQRRETTLRSIEALSHAANSAAIELQVYLLDDGSSDGTPEAVRGLMQSAKIFHGDGDFFWARSMATAEQAALSEAENEDLILWLNDDVVLDHDSLERLVAEVADPCSVVVGATRDADTNAVTYGGFRSTKIHPLRFTTVPPSETEVVAVDTFNGNVVLVPVPLARRVGGIDGAFSHALADIDYGLRVDKIGGRVLLAPGTFGTCPRNPPLSQLPIREEWQRFRGIKGGGNPASLRHFLRRHAPRRRMIATTWTIGIWWIRQVLQRGIKQLER